MLQRPPPKPPPADKAEERRRLRRERSVRYRQRRRSEQWIIPVLISPAVRDLLCELGFLQQWDVEDRAKVREALQCALHVWATYDADPI